MNIIIIMSFDNYVVLEVEEADSVRSISDY